MARNIIRTVYVGERLETIYRLDHKSIRVKPDSYTLKTNRKYSIRSIKIVMPPKEIVINKEIVDVYSTWVFDKCRCRFWSIRQKDEDSNIIKELNSVQIGLFWAIVKNAENIRKEFKGNLAIVEQGVKKRKNELEWRTFADMKVDSQKYIASEWPDILYGDDKGYNGIKPLKSFILTSGIKHEFRFNKPTK